MSDNLQVAKTYAPELVGSVVHVAGGLIGSSLIDRLRKNYTSNSQVQRGDYIMDRSRILLQSHLQLIALLDRGQTKIQRNYEKLQKVKRGLDSHDHDGSMFQMFLKARQYRRVSKQSYEIKDASERAIYKRLLDQIAEAMRPPGSGSGNGESGSGGSGSGPMTSVISNLFSDSHAISNSSSSQVTVNELDQVEMSTYQEETTNQAAVVLNLFGRDESAQHLVVTFSTAAFSGDRTDSGASQSIAPEAPVALSLHREDGSSPFLITALQTDVSESDERVDEQAGTSTLDLLARSEPVTSKRKHLPPPKGASVHLIDDPDTGSFAPRKRRK